MTLSHFKAAVSDFIGLLKQMLPQCRYQSICIYIFYTLMLMLCYKSKHSYTNRSAFIIKSAPAGWYRNFIVLRAKSIENNSKILLLFGLNMFLQATYCQNDFSICCRSVSSDRFLSTCIFKSIKNVLTLDHLLLI